VKSKYINSSILFLATVSVLSTGCGADLPSLTDASSGGDTTTNGLSAAVSTITTQLSAVAGMSDYTTFAKNNANARISANATTMMAAPNFGSDWTTSLTGLGDPRVSGSTSISPKDFMGLQLDDSVRATDDGHAINAFGRMNDAFRILCAVGVGANAMGYTVDEFGYLADGSYTITFSAAIKSEMSSTCGLDATNIPDDTTMTMTVAAGGSNYDKVFTFNTFNQKYMVKNDASVLRVASSETSDYHYSRSLAEYNKSSGLTRAEYVTVPKLGQSAGTEVFRFYYDATNDVGMILGLFANNTSMTQGQRFIVSGKPSVGDAFSLSMRIDLAFGDTNSREACVTASNGNIATDGARCTASSTRLAGEDVAAVDSNVSTWYTTYVNDGASGPANTVRDDWGHAALSDSKLIGFNSMSTLVSTPIAP
jgi:hypothetical protein